MVGTRGAEKISIDGARARCSPPAVRPKKTSFLSFKISSSSKPRRTDWMLCPRRHSLRNFCRSSGRISTTLKLPSSHSCVISQERSIAESSRVWKPRKQGKRSTSCSAHSSFRRDLQSSLSSTRSARNSHRRQRRVCGCFRTQFVRPTRAPNVIGPASTKAKKR